VRTTHTYAVLEISPEAYREIRERLEAAGYQHAFHRHVHEVTRGGALEGEVSYEAIDMHGIALRADDGRPVVLSVPDQPGPAAGSEGQQPEGA